MNFRLAAALVLAFPASANATECLLEQATYGQPGTDWQLRFAPVPPDAAANMIASFSIGIPGTQTRLTGGIYIPNGFGQAWGLLNAGCADANETCELWDGVVYATGGDGIIELPHEAAQPAPRQILLPGLSGDLWYSVHRADAFTDESGPIDVFTLEGCAP